MKNLFRLLILCLLLACISLTASAEGDSLVIGVLSYLNLSEEDYTAYVLARVKAVELLFNSGFVKLDPAMQSTASGDNEIQVIFYDSLGEMLMDLSAGNITAFEVPQSTADYLCHRNPSMFKGFVFELTNLEQFEKTITERMSDGFAFMLMEYNAGLRDEFNTAIAAMKEDGTIDELVQKYIREVILGGSMPEILLEEKEGRDTITVAVTGSLPPMDFVAPDGSFGGFNTAILAEIGRRLDKNIELIQIENLGRASALATGRADAAFWTRSTPNPQITGMSDEEYAAFVEELKASYTDEQSIVLRSLSEALSRTQLDERDMPEGTIITDPYFVDITVPVMMRP